MGKFFIPIYITFSFITFSQLGYFYLFFIILLSLNIFNLFWGTFKDEELKTTISAFYSNRTVVWLKRISGIFLILFIVWAIYYFDQNIYYLWEYLLFTLTVGCITGCFLITLAHDLMHSSSLLDKTIATGLLLMICTPYLEGDHKYAHHRLVGLKEDESTAKLNKSVYNFFMKNLISRFRNSYLKKSIIPSSKISKYIIKNIILGIIYFIICITIFMISDQSIKTLFFFILQGFIAYFLYECINYIQHYGLIRSQENKINQNCSWNCYYKYTNYILFMLPIHSLHHLPNEGKDLQTEDIKNAPTMPYLYFVMLALALLPPIWFKKMNSLALIILKQNNYGKNSEN